MLNIISGIFLSVKYKKNNLIRAKHDYHIRHLIKFEVILHLESEKWW